VLIALVARVLAKHPRINSSWTGTAIQTNADVNISVAMAVKDGVVAPVITKANVESLARISALRRDLARARSREPAASRGYQRRDFYDQQSRNVQG